LTRVGRHACPQGKLWGTPLVHGDHEDVVQNNVLHCPDLPHCMQIDLVDIPAQSDWNDIFDL
jgi:hypothetical protein